ncbi:MAG TPA: type II secretion system protein GspJ [Kofleriaceae bacterium]|jgi:general secretion pathway protein J|nr:type II secretion system protein GspJ [Kofleriaceae bacterium]
MTSRDRRQRGLTLVEIMIAMGIMALMMMLAWSTIKNASDARVNFEALEERNHEIRLALARVSHDLESAYLSINENTRLDNRRTMFIGKSEEVRFSSFGHVSLWADANESDQTVITYFLDDDREDSSLDDLYRRELRRPSNDAPSEQPAELDVLLRGVDKLQFEYWDWQDKKWQDSWDSTKPDAEGNRLPSRVRITVHYTNPRGDELKLSTQARLVLQQPLTQ